MHGLDKSMSRLLNFSEHYFREDLTNLAIDHITRHLSNFRDLLAQIASQKEFTASFARDEIPCPVAFSIPPLSKFGSEDWPEPTSDEWISAAASHLRSTPPALCPAREKAPLEERLANAEQKRRKLENQKNRKIRDKTNKVRRAVELREQRKEEAMTSIAEKQDGAAQRREALLLQIKEKAHSEVEKIQENRFIQGIDIETRKLSYQKTMNEAKARHEEVVRAKSRDAKDRAAKAPDSPSHDPRDWPVPFNIEAAGEIEAMPDFAESAAPFAPEAVAAFDRLKKSNDVMLMLAFLKAVAVTQGAIARGSDAALKVAQMLLDLVAANSAHALQGVRHVAALAATSRGFAVDFAVQAVPVFQQLCEQHNPFQLAGQIVGLWGSVMKARVGERVLLRALQQTGVLRALCSLFEAVGGDDVLPEIAELISGIIEFFQIAVTFLHRENSDDGGFPAVVVPAFLGFFRTVAPTPRRFRVESLVAAARVMSGLAVDFGSAVVAAVDEQLAASLVHVLKTFLGSANCAIVPITHELIILFGMLCRWSAVLRESCRWLPPPALLTKLCQLPLSYFVQKAQAGILVPTLVACCIDSEENTQIVLETVSGILIAKFVKEMVVKDMGITAPQHRIPVERVAELVQLFSTPVHR